MSHVRPYWFHAMVATVAGQVIARVWSYGGLRPSARCRSREPGTKHRCMWEAGHPLARHMTFLSPEAWPKGPPQSIEWGKNPNPYGKRRP